MFSIDASVLVAIRHSVNAMYASPNCLLKLVNTTAPQHYAIHPVWKDMVYDDSCDLNVFVQQQFDNKVQFVFFEKSCALLFVVAVASLLFNLRKLISLRGVVSTMMGYCLALNGVMNLLMITHFEQDVTFFSANIMHHADISAFTDQSNASLVHTLPQGFVLTSLLNMIYANAFVYVVAKYDPVAKRGYYPLLLAAIFALQTIRALVMIKEGHPELHNIATEEGQYASMWSQEFAAYRHVFIHHVNGDSFGSSYTFDWIYSLILYAYGEWHNLVLQLQLDTPAHYGFAVFVDGGMMTLWSLAVWAYLRASATLMTVLFGGPIDSEEVTAKTKKE